jgi:hypothetical protein
LAVSATFAALTTAQEVRQATTSRYDGPARRVTQVAFVNDSRSKSPRDLKASAAHSKLVTMDEQGLQWRTRPVSTRPVSTRPVSTGAVSTGAVSTGAVSTGAVSTGAVSTNTADAPKLNPPSRNYRMADRSAAEVDANGVRWSAPSQRQRIQSNRTPLDPFNNPFDDRTSRGSTAARAPTPTAPTPTAPMPRTRQGRTVPVQTQIPQPKFSSEDVGLLQEDIPCDHIYNFQNCCVGDKRCETAHERFANVTLRDIHLDITPMLNPAALGQTNDSPPDRTLTDASRVWKNRAGAVIAEGVLADFVNGRVRIETTDGQLVTIPARELSNDDRCYFSAWWHIPAECSLADEAYAGRQWLPMTMTWKASALCHNPLYFEEVNLERYGHTAGPILQPVVSGAHFFFNIAALPYKMGIHPMNECMYPLGTYREGDCAPWLVPPVPISLRGAVMEAGVITGGIFILP